MSNLHSILEKIDNLRMQVRPGGYAPHKPLLILYALGELSRGEETVSFHKIVVPFTRLLKEFGPWRRVHHPESPFWYLRNDKLWVVTADGPLVMSANNAPSRAELIRKDAIGSFHPEALKVLRSSPENIRIVAEKVLDVHFPETLHRDILVAVGLGFGFTQDKQRRDPEFRWKVLRAYENQCCVCGYDLRLVGELAGLDAAHIMWHSAGGPDEESNGLALCVFHHKAFDLGAYTVDADDLKILCSDELSGSNQRDWLIGYHGLRIREPQSSSYFPKEEYLNWHRKERFKGLPRELV